MTHLDAFLQHGPVHGHHVTGLDELRRVILLDGIPANSEGMVSEALRIGS
jgi:cell cycle arrest protein BUB2